MGVIPTPVLLSISKVTYEGIPVDVQLYETKVGFFKWLFSLFKMLCEFLLNLIIYILIEYTFGIFVFLYISKIEILINNF